MQASSRLLSQLVHIACQKEFLPSSLNCLLIRGTTGIELRTLALAYVLSHSRFASEAGLTMGTYWIVSLHITRRHPILQLQPMCGTQMRMQLSQVLKAQMTDLTEKHRGIDRTCHRLY